MYSKIMTLNTCRLWENEFPAQSPSFPLKRCLSACLLESAYACAGKTDGRSHQARGLLVAIGYLDSLPWHGLILLCEQGKESDDAFKQLKKLLGTVKKVKPKTADKEAQKFIKSYF